MNINIDNPAQILSHVLLEDKDLVNAVVSSKQWQELGEIKGTLILNDVEVSADVLENTLQSIFDQIETYTRSKYNADDFDARVEEKAQELIKEHADNCLEKMGELQRVLEMSEQLIKPHWER